MLGTSTPTSVFVEVVASELACGVERAVDSWLGEIERAIQDPHLTTLGRLYAVQSIITRYKQIAGKDQLTGIRRA
jgi:hypothetical protein